MSSQRSKAIINRAIFSLDIQSTDFTFVDGLRVRNNPKNNNFWIISENEKPQFYHYTKYSTYALARLLNLEPVSAHNFCLILQNCKMRKKPLKNGVETKSEINDKIETCIAVVDIRTAKK